MKKFKIIPVGGGWFNIKSCFCVIKIQDIHPGYGGDIVEPIKFRKNAAEKFIRVLNLCKINWSKPINWKLMSRIKSKLKIDYCYD